MKPSQVFLEKKEEKRHQQFVNGGIEKAVEKLNELEKESAISILAFSIGGTIAWKYALKNKNVMALYGVSATRIRYETLQPECPVFLYYGDEDLFAPKEAWFDRMKLTAIKVNGDHNLYMEHEFARLICEKINDDFHNDLCCYN